MSERDNMDLTPEERQLQDAVRGLGEVRADDAFREKLRQQFMSGEIDAEGPSTESAGEPVAEDNIVEMPRRRHGGRWGALIAVAAALAIIFLNQGAATWELQNVRGQGTLAINGQEVSATDRDAVAALIAPQMHLVAPEGVELDVVLGKVMVVGVAGPVDAVMPDLPEGDPRVFQVTVNTGEFRIKTGPDFPGSQALLLTTEGRVEITGTSVAVFKNADLTCVCVLEGTALIGKDGDNLDAIPAGQRKVMFADGSDPLITTIEPGHKHGLLEFEAFNQGIFK